MGKYLDKGNKWMTLDEKKMGSSTIRYMIKQGPSSVNSPSPQPPSLSLQTGFPHFKHIKQTKQLHPSTMRFLQLMAPPSLPFVKLLKKYWSTFIFPIPPLLLFPKCCNLLSVHFPLLAWHTPRKSVTSLLPSPVGLFSNYLTSFCAEFLAVLPLTCISFFSLAQWAHLFFLNIIIFVMNPNQ